MNEASGRLEKKFHFQHKFPPTKILWHPSESVTNPDILVTSGDILRLWQIEDNERASLRCSFTNAKKELTAPLTSFDWSCKNTDTVIACSIDTTCSIWDVNKETLVKTLIAHDKEVFDVSFSPDPQIFATVGADGSLRNFDIR